MTQQLELFYRNWLGKADSYIENSLANIFDRFTSLYVAYNSLYMDIMTELTKLGFNITKNFQDKKAATDYVIQYIKSRFLVDQLLNNQISIDQLNEICNIIQDERFHIILDWGVPQRQLDLELLNNLRSNSKQEKAKAILDLFYHVRCNLFHGHKGFEDHQRQLLIPINYLLRKTVVIVYNKLSIL
jgi:hypothetical protein